MVCFVIHEGAFVTLFTSFKWVAQYRVTQLHKLCPSLYLLQIHLDFIFENKQYWQNGL